MAFIDNLLLSASEGATLSDIINKDLSTYLKIVSTLSYFREIYGSDICQRVGGFEYFQIVN